MDKAIQDFIECKRLAVVGVSRTPGKFGNLIFKELGERGYEVYAVNPAMTEINGQPCYPNLAALNGKIDGAVLVLKPDKAVEIVREAAAIGLRSVWLQQGADSTEAARVAGELGLSAVSGKCILMYAQPVQSFHKVHRFFAQIFGQL